MRFCRLLSHSPCMRKRARKTAAMRCGRLKRKRRILAKREVIAFKGGRVQFNCRISLETQGGQGCDSATSLIAKRRKPPRRAALSQVGLIRYGVLLKMALTESLPVRVIVHEFGPVVV